MANTISDLELATALNVDKSTAWRWRTKHGMPNTSIALARDWASNRAATKNMQDVEDVPDPVPVDGDVCYDVLARLRVNEQVIAGEARALTLALNRARAARNTCHDPEETARQEKKVFSYTQMLKAVRKEHRDATKSLFAAESAVVALEKQRGNLVTLDSAKELVSKLLLPVIYFLKRLPDGAEDDAQKKMLTDIGNRGLALIRGEENV